MYHDRSPVLRFNDSQRDRETWILRICFLGVTNGRRTTVRSLCQSIAVEHTWRDEMYTLKPLLKHICCLPQVIWDHSHNSTHSQHHQTHTSQHTVSITKHTLLLRWLCWSLIAFKNILFSLHCSFTPAIVWRVNIVVSPRRLYGGLTL